MIRTNVTRSIIVSSLLCGTVWAAAPQIGTTKQLSLPPPSVPQKLPPVKQVKPNKATQAVSPKYREGEVIVKYKSGIKKTTINSLSSAQGFKVVKTYSKLTKKNLITVLKSNKTTQEMIKILKADPNVESVSPNYIRQLDAAPNDPDFSQLWGMHNTGQTGGSSDADIDAVEAWDVTTGSSDVVVAVFDTGVDYTHTDLKTNLWINQGETPNDGIDNDGNGYIDDIYGYDVAADTNGTNDGDPLDEHGHGTHVSGTIGAKGNDGFGISGVNWDVKIMSLKIFPAYSGAAQSDILEAIEYVTTMKERGINIVAINASYGGGSGSQDDLMNDAIKGLGDAGIIFCAAAGNDGVDNDAEPHFPSSYDADNIISVASTDHNDELSWFSNYGATSADIAAPGSSILSTTPYTLDHTPGASDLFFDNVEDGSTGPWWFGASEDSEGDNSWYYNSSIYHSESRSITDGSVDGGDYANNQFKYIGHDQYIDLSAELDNEDLAFSFWAQIDVEPYYDALHLFFYNEADGWSVAESFDGYDLPMQKYTVKIPRAFRTDKFTFLFALSTDSIDTADGVFIDDIGIGNGVRINDNYATWNGTSMATPHVTGAVALISASYTGDTVAGRKARILNNVDTPDSLSGKLLTEGRLNLKSAIGTGGICQEGYHYKQGTTICISGTPTDDPGYYLPSCVDGERLIQGTENCVSTTPVDPTGIYLPSCPEGEQLIQGTEVCAAIPG